MPSGAGSIEHSTEGKSVWIAAALCPRARIVLETSFVSASCFKISERKGVPRIGASALGRCGTTGVRRVPSPPARMMASMLFLHVNDRRAFVFKLELDLEQTCKSRSHGRLRLWGDEEGEEAAAAGAAEFTAVGAALEGSLVVLVDDGSGDLGGEFFLEIPTFVEQFPEVGHAFVGWGVGEDFFGFEDHFVHAVEVKIVRESFGFFDLLFSDIVGVSGNSGVENKQVVLEELFFFGRDNERADSDVRAFELENIHAAKGGVELVLGADIFSDELLFDVACLFGQPLLRDLFPIQSVESVEKADSERR